MNRLEFSRLLQLRKRWKDQGTGHTCRSRRALKVATAVNLCTMSIACCVVVHIQAEVFEAERMCEDLVDGIEGGCGQGARVDCMCRRWKTERTPDLETNKWGCENAQVMPSPGRIQGDNCSKM